MDLVIADWHFHPYRWECFFVSMGSTLVKRQGSGSWSAWNALWVCHLFTAGPWENYLDKPFVSLFVHLKTGIYVGPISQGGSYSMKRADDPCECLISTVQSLRAWTHISFGSRPCWCPDHMSPLLTSTCAAAPRFLFLGLCWLPREASLAHAHFWLAGLQN